LFIKKNKYLFFLIVFLFALQIIPFCNAVYCYEKQVQVSSQNQTSNAADVKQKEKKAYKKRLYRHYYRKKPVKSFSVVKPATQPSSVQNNNYAGKEQDLKQNVTAGQKQLNLQDFPGKKYSLENIQSNKPDKGYNFLSVLSSLFFVILLVIIFGWFYAKLKNVDPASLLAGKFSDKYPNKFNILSTATLGQGKNIHLIEINGKYLVIGSTINNISLLTELSSDKICINNEMKDLERLEEANDISTEHELSNNDEIYKKYLRDKDSKSKKIDNDL